MKRRQVTPEWLSAHSVFWQIRQHAIKSSKIPKTKKIKLIVDYQTSFSSARHIAILFEDGTFWCHRSSDIAKHRISWREFERFLEPLEKLGVISKDEAAELREDKTRNDKIERHIMAIADLKRICKILGITEPKIPPFDPEKDYR